MVLCRTSTVQKLYWRAVLESRTLFITDFFTFFYSKKSEIIIFFAGILLYEGSIGDCNTTVHCKYFCCKFYSRWMCYICHCSLTVICAVKDQ